MEEGKSRDAAGLNILRVLCVYEHLGTSQPRYELGEYDGLKKRVNKEERGSFSNPKAK